MFNLKRMRWLVPLGILLNYAMQETSEQGQSVVYYLFTIYFALYAIISLIQLLKEMFTHGIYIVILLFLSEVVFKKGYKVIVSNSLDNMKELISTSVESKSKDFVDIIKKAKKAVSSII